MENTKQISTWLYKISTGWVTLAGLIIFLLFTGFVLPAQANNTGDLDQEAGSPDMSFTYTPKKLYEIAEAYGLQGRIAYIQARFTFDLVWPLVYTLFLSTAISWNFNHASISLSRLRSLNLAPLLGMALDYAENIATSVVMFQYPTTTNILAFLAPIFTATKWIFVAGSFGILFIGIIAMIWQFAKIHLDGFSA